MALLSATPSTKGAAAPAKSTLAAIAQLTPSHLVSSMIIFQRIYVGSVQFDITEKDLEMIFSQFGVVQRIDMMQDPVNRRHRGFGFIEFDTPEAAALAQLQMDRAQLGGRTVKVGRPNNFPADLPPGVPRPLTNRIYVANVHELVREEELRLIFEAFGTVRFCHLSPNPSTGGHKGYAYVEYESEGAAERALHALNNFELAKRRLKVGRTITGGPIPPGMDNLHGGTSRESSLYPSNQGNDTGGTGEGKDDDGNTANPSLLVSSSSSSSKGGKSNNITQVPEAVLRAIEEINASLASSSTTQGVTVLPSETRVMALRNLEDYGNIVHGKRNSTDSNIISTLTDTTTDQSNIKELEVDVAEECSRFGTIEQCKVHLDHRQQTVTVLVKFASKECLQEALRVMHLRWFGGRRIVAEPFAEHLFDNVFTKLK